MDKTPGIGKRPRVGPTNRNARLTGNRCRLLPGLYCTAVKVQYHFVRVYHFIAVLLNSGCHLSEVKFACRDLVLLHYCADSLLQLAAFAAVVAIRCSLLYVHYFDTLHE